MVAVKQLKFYSSRFASSVIAAYEGLFELSHSNVVKVLGICPKEGYIIMEYCEKVVDGITVRTLADLQLHFGSLLPLDLRITAIADVADGIQYLHDKGVVHGDIKPLNVLVCGEENEQFCFKVTDYVYLGNKIATPSSSKPVSIKQLMTPAYMAPELFSDDGIYSQPTASSDVYSLGLLAYEVILGIDPWKNVSFDLIERVRHGYRPVIPDTTPEHIVSIIEKCWLHDHLLRPSAFNVYKELEHYLDSNDDESNSTEVNNDDTEANSFLAIETSPLKEVPVSSISVASGGYEVSHSIDVAHASLPDHSDVPHGSISLVENTDVPHGSLSHETDVPHALSSEPWLLGDIATAKSQLNIRELKEFQTQCLAAINRGNDVIVVQPTGSGKLVCFTLPALLSHGKVSLVIEPIVAIIINQVEMLQRKGIDAIALGNAAGIPKKTANYRPLFKECTDLPKIVFCTPEYLFGTPSSGTYSGTSGMFHIFVDNSEMFCMVTIDEAHKVFDRMPDYRSTFDSMKRLKELSCPIVAMSATLTDKQISELKQEFLRSDKCIVLINSVSRSNLQILLQ